MTGKGHASSDEARTSGGGVTVTGAPRATVSEQRSRGKLARASMPLADHAMFDPTELRPDPIELLQRQEASRISELLPLRYGRMVASPLSFYRGAALVMAADLATVTSSGLRVQLCGDAHLGNFGVFGSPERRLLFDLNDFDETLPGPFEWDVKRLAASLEIAARSQSFEAKKRREIVLTASRSYRETMREFAGMSNLEVWYARVDADELMVELRATMSAKRLRRVEAMLDKARSRDSLQAFDKLTTVQDGHVAIVADPPLVVPVEDLFSEEDVDPFYASMVELLSSYRESLASDRQHLFDEYRVVDMARKVVGVGSVGTRAWIVLMEGKDSDDPLFLQSKEAQSSVLEQYLGVSGYSNHGERVVSGQRLMQAASDIFIGWQHTSGLDGVDRDYYVRQLRDWKGSAEVEGSTPEGMAIYARVCGWTLARAHARSGDRVGIASYLGRHDTFEQAVTDFAATYADQNDRDHAALRAAIDDGRVEAQEGV